MYQQLADELNAAPIQHIGKLLVLWRPKPAKERPSTKTACPARATSRC
jgi:RNA-binding protein